MSHPVGMCGLKPWVPVPDLPDRESHPVGMCGLKLNPLLQHAKGTTQSHPVGMCGLKHNTAMVEYLLNRSHPVGMCGLKHYDRHPISNYGRSHPVGMCGLKHKNYTLCHHQWGVTSRRDVWIETSYHLQHPHRPLESHPVGMCGLKLKIAPGFPPP